jgi:DsbC/DsbD-like thiol-disulfide interchange protein
MIKALAALMLLGVVSQPASGPLPKMETAHLSVATSASRLPGDRVSLVVEVTPKRRMHVYAPDKSQTYIPVALSLDPREGLTAQPPKFPAAEKYFFEPLKETQLVYSRPFRIVLDVTLAPGKAPVTLTGTLRYQACDDKVCYMPQTVRLTWMAP